MQLLLASHNLSGMSYFGGLGRNILCNVSLSQGNKFLRPPAVSMVPCFRARRIWPQFSDKSQAQSFSNVFSLFNSQRILLFCSCTVPCKKEKRGSFSSPAPNGGALREYLSPSPFLSQYSGRSCVVFGSPAL